MAVLAKEQAKSRWETTRTNRGTASRIMRDVLGNENIELEDMTPEQRDTVEAYEKADREYLEACDEYSQYCKHPPERLWSGSYRDEDGKLKMWVACCDCGKVLMD